MQEGFRDLLLQEVSEIKNALFGTDNPQNEEIKLSEIPDEHKQYARLVGETYDGERRNIEGFKYEKSLYINNFLTPILTGYGVEKMSEKITQSIAKNVVAKRSGLLRELGGREMLNYNFLQYLIPIIREQRYMGEETIYLTPDDIQYTAEQADTLRPYLTNMYGGMFDHIQADNNIQWVQQAMNEIENVENQEFYEVQQPYYDFWYEPDLYKFLPVSFIGVAMFSIAYKKALINMEVKPKQENIFTPKRNNERLDPRINYYTKGNQDVFTIRGTKDTGDIANDAVFGVQSAVKSKTGIGIFSEAITKKIDLMEEFILNNKRENSEVIIASHSLGSIEMGVLHKRLQEKGIKITGVGYAHPVLPPRDSKDLTYYSYKLDPLYEPSNAKNHKFLNKAKSGKSLKEIFNNFHSINNYY